MKVLKYIIVVVVSLIVGGIISLIIFFSLMPILNVASQSYFDTKSTSDIVSILSLNVGILQGLIALITLRIGSVALFNFLSMKKEFKKFKRNVSKQVKALKDRNYTKETNKKELKNITEEIKSIEENKEGVEIKDDF